MQASQITTIAQVIDALEQIIHDTKTQQSPLGYFAALYQQVTIQVKKGIETNYFEDGARMEELDVIFAKRYLVAYEAFQGNKTITTSWQKSFNLAESYWPVVLQHLLIGMNAHINLDLGIAAAEVMQGKDLHALKNDFNKINEVLSSLVSQVQTDLANIWPTLKWMLKLSGKADDLLVDFSMKLARDGAWNFAKELASQPVSDWESIIATRDMKVAKKAKIITSPGKIGNIVLGIVRLGERGSVGEKINLMDRKIDT